jgi:hypothetical protein
MGPLTEATMSLVRCPHCSAAVPENPQLTGQVVICFHCSGRFTMPAAAVPLVSESPLSVATPPAGPQIPELPSSVNVLITDPRPNPRLHASDWFSRRFPTASGVLLPVLLFSVAAAGLVALTVCGGCFVVFDQAINRAQERRDADQWQVTARAKKFAQPRLEELGVVDIDNQAKAYERIGEVTYAGKAKLESGRIVDFYITWDVAKSGNEKKWQLKAILLDGQLKRGTIDDL